MCVTNSLKSDNRESFSKKKHSCGVIFSKLCYTPILLILLYFPLIEIIQEGTSFQFIIHVQ